MDIEKTDNDINLTQFRDMIMSVQEKILNDPNSYNCDDDPEFCPLEHSFGDGIYVRQIKAYKGQLLITKIHKITHPYFILEGDCSIMTETGVKRVKAPFYGMTQAGTKRIVYVHEDTVWVTCHVTDKTDLKEIEDDIIDKDFESLDISVIEKFRDLTRKVIAEEKYGFWSDWTKEQQELYMNSDWETFSRSRGYDEEAIKHFRQWLKMIDEAEAKGINILKSASDLIIEAANKNIALDKRGEIMKSSYMPRRKAEVELCHFG